MQHRTRALSAVSIFSMLAVMPGIALAQAGSAAQSPRGTENTPPGSADAPNTDVTTMAPAAGDIVVTGLRRSLQSAQTIKRDSKQIVDTVVAEDIGKLPDNNAAEALSRIPGVQVTRGSDEAGGVQVRGLPNLTTTFNNREIYTAEQRNVALQDFPAGALAGLEVYKTTTADQIEGGIAGLINVRSRRPFDFEGLELAGAVRGTYSDQSRQYDPNFNLLVSDRWHTGIGDIGALVNVSYTQLHYLTSSRNINGNVVSPGADQPITTPGVGRNFVLPESAGVYYDRGKRWRPSVNGSIQWRPASNLDIYADGLWQGARTHVYNDSLSLNNVAGSPTLSDVVIDPANPSKLSSVTVIPNAANGQDINFSRGARYGRTNTFQGAVGATLKLHRATITTDLAYTASSARYNDINFDYAPSTPQRANIVFDVPGEGGSQLSIPGFDAKNPANFILRGLYDRRSLQVGKGWQWRTDLVLETGLPVIHKLDAGIRFTDRDAYVRSGGRYATLRSLGLPITSAPSGDSGEPIDAGFRGSDAQSFRSWYAPTWEGMFGSIEQIRDFSRSNLLRINTPASLAELALWGSPIPAYVDAEGFNAKERSYAAYAQVEYGFDIGPIPIDGVVGARVVDTTERLTGTGLVNNVPTPQTSQQNYVDILPSASFRAHLTDKLQLRLSYTETRTRPEFNQLNPAFTVNLQSIPLSGTSGNINLKPITSTNYDVSIEWYYSHTGSITGALFRRDVNGFINNFTTLVQYPTYGAVLVNRPENGGKGKLQGAEVALQTFFDFLPGWLSGFGVQVNGTYIDGSQQLPATLGATAAPVEIPSVSKWSYNAIALYEKGPISTSLAYNYRSRVVNSYDNSRIGQSIASEYTLPVERLDFSLAVTPVRAVTITFDVSNITGAPYRAVREVPGQNGADYPRDTRYESRLFALGARFRF